MSKPGVFYMNFTFFDETAEEDPETLCGFNITPEGVSKLQLDTNVGRFQEFLNQVDSEFGIHDWSSFSNGAVEGIGCFTSDEFYPDEVDELMNRWLDFISDMAGPENVSPQWVSIDAKPEADDLEIYNIIQSALTTQSN